MSPTWCNGLYSYTYNGQVVKTVDILGEVGYMAAPGEDHNQEERGKMSFKSGQFSDQVVTCLSSLPSISCLLIKHPRGISGVIKIEGHIGG